MAYNSKELIKILLENGWELDRIRGSHHVFNNEKLKKSVPVPVHGNRDMGKGILYAILKQCEIDKKK